MRRTHDSFTLSNSSVTVTTLAPKTGLQTNRSLYAQCPLVPVPIALNYKLVKYSKRHHVIN